MWEDIFTEVYPCKAYEGSQRLQISGISVYNIIVFRNIHCTWREMDDSEIDAWHVACNLINMYTELLAYIIEGSY
jgi:hypothetical protein